ncbi:MAG: hypothetical protein WCG55_00540 [bacterium]
MDYFTDEHFAYLPQFFGEVATFATEAGSVGSCPITINQTGLQKLQRDLRQTIIAPKPTGGNESRLYVMIMAVTFRKSIRFMLKTEKGEYVLKYQTTFGVESGGEIIFFYPVNEVSPTAAIVLQWEEDVPNMFTVYIEP